MKVTTRYEGKLRFTGGEGDARVVMDARVEKGGIGIAPNPKEMVLHGLAGCTGLDVVAMLERKGVTYERFSIDVEAEQTKLHPMVFKSIKITYRFVGDPADRAEIERAIVLSEKQFCGVSAMLQKTARIDWELEIVPRG